MENKTSFPLTFFRVDMDSFILLRFGQKQRTFQFQLKKSGQETYFVVRGQETYFVVRGQETYFVVRGQETYFVVVEVLSSVVLVSFLTAYISGPGGAAGLLTLPSL